MTMKCNERIMNVRKINDRTKSINSNNFAGYS